MRYLALLMCFIASVCFADFDRNDPADLLALKNEVNTDPDGLGYNPSSGSTTLVLETINLKRAAYPVEKPKISAADVRGATTYDAYNTLAIDEQEWLRWITGSGGFGEENIQVTADLRLQLADPDGDGTASIWAAAHRAAMNAAMWAIIQVNGSRAEALFGYGTVITRDDWIAARDS